MECLDLFPAQQFYYISFHLFYLRVILCDDTERWPSLSSSAAPLHFTFITFLNHHLLLCVFNAFNILDALPLAHVPFTRFQTTCPVMCSFYWNHVAPDPEHIRRVDVSPLFWICLIWDTDGEIDRAYQLHFAGKVDGGMLCSLLFRRPVEFSINSKLTLWPCQCSPGNIVSCPTLKIRIQKDRSRVYRNDDVCAVEFNSFVLRCQAKMRIPCRSAKISLVLFIQLMTFIIFQKIP